MENYRTAEQIENDALKAEAYQIDRFVVAYKRFLAELRKERFKALPRRQRYRMMAMGHGV